jgi:hypothetical protein
MEGKTARPCRKLRRPFGRARRDCESLPRACCTRSTFRRPSHPPPLLAAVSNQKAVTLRMVLHDLPVRDRAVVVRDPTHSCPYKRSVRRGNDRSDTRFGRGGELGGFHPTRGVVRTKQTHVRRSMTAGGDRGGRSARSLPGYRSHSDGLRGGHAPPRSTRPDFARTFWRALLKRSHRAYKRVHGECGGGRRSSRPRWPTPMGAPRLSLPAADSLFAHVQTVYARGL